MKVQLLKLTLKQKTKSRVKEIAFNLIKVYAKRKLEKGYHLEKEQLNVADTMYKQKRLPNMAILLNSVDHKKGNNYSYGYGQNPSTKKKWWKFA